MVELLLIRHAETDYNRQLRVQGHVDVPLNAIGRAQAARLAARLADEPIDLLVSSDLQRARQTAEPLAAQRGLALATDPAWREQAFGVLEGLDGPALRLGYPEQWQAWLRHDPDGAPPGGESRRRFFDRVWQALHALAAAHAGARVAVVTHGGVLDMVWRGVHAQPLAAPRSVAIPNTGLNRLQALPCGDGHAAGADAPGFVVLQWADAAHLAGMAEAPVHYPTAAPA